MPDSLAPPAYFSRFLMIALDAVILINEAQAIVFCNESARRLFACEGCKVIGQPLEIFIPERFRHNHRQQVAAFFKNRPNIRERYMRGPIVGRRSDGSEFPAEASIAVVDTDEGPICGVILRDISERMAHEAALQESIDELDAFAHTVAHDLKNPLHYILGFSEILRQDYQSLSQEEFETMLGHIQHAARNANTIIQELLLLATVRKVDVLQSTVSVEVIVERLLQRFADDIERTGATVRLPASWPLVLSYAAWLEELLFNYFSNAIKYGGEPPEIQIVVAPAPTPGLIRIGVRDNGRGLSKSEQATIFTEFQRLGDLKTKGDGLGLSIVQRIANKLGIEIGVESSIGRGSFFFVDCPQA